MGYIGAFICAGEAARMRVDAERQFAQAAQQQGELEEKLSQVERKAQLMLNKTEQNHMEQLEVEHQQKVQYESVGALKNNQARDHLALGSSPISNAF